MLGADLRLADLPLEILERNFITVPRRSIFGTVEVYHDPALCRASPACTNGQKFAGSVYLLDNVADGSVRNFETGYIAAPQQTARMCHEEVSSQRGHFILSAAPQ
jgi:hypothetical protein